MGMNMGILNIFPRTPLPPNSDSHELGAARVCVSSVAIAPVPTQTPPPTPPLKRGLFGRICGYKNSEIEGREQGLRQRRTTAAGTNLAAPPNFGGSSSAQKSIRAVDFLASPSPLKVGDGEARKSKKKQKDWRLLKNKNILKLLRWKSKEPQGEGEQDAGKNVTEPGVEVQGICV
jgi:hypothetical protein